MAERKTPPPNVIDPARNYTATVRTERGDFSIRLNPAVAPITVNNFVHLAQNGYYQGLTFHRVVPGFVVQGGDPTGSGRGGPGYTLPDETNPSPWVEGSVGMASNPATGVNGSQFFVLTGDAPSLATSGVYNHFGNVTSGMEVVTSIREGDRISRVEVAVA
jgi:cyclophilin family peptidyl-prolyl cis-trans isomerase